MKKMFKETKGVLFDIDGVLHVGREAIPGAALVLTHLDAKGIPYRFVTNTTTKSPENLRRALSAMGIPVAGGMIVTTHEVAAQYLRNAGTPSCFFLIDDDAAPAYSGIDTDDERPDFVVIGDIGDRWNYAILNRVFNMIMEGSKMLALHKGRYWKTEGGLQMDIGVFVAGLEYATGRDAIVVGKPSTTFFEVGVRQMNIDNKHAIMIGDDIESDIGGAQRAGIRGVLVRTGKYREEAAARSSVRPDAVIDSVADLVNLL